MFTSPSEVAFNILGYPIYFYGIIMALAVLIGFWSAYFFYKKYYDKEQALLIIDFSPYLIIIGILAARLYYCLLNFQYYLKYPLEIFDIRQGGLSIHGMIIVGIIAVYYFAKKHKINFLKLLDSFLCALPLAQSVGRWGNFFNSEAFGTPTNLPWKLFIPTSHRPFEYINYEYFHPTFLYESILDLLIFLLLFKFFGNFSKKPGTISCLYLMLYSIVRIFVEYLRIDSALNLAGLPIAQLVSFFMFLTAVFCFCFIRR